MRSKFAALPCLFAASVLLNACTVRAADEGQPKMLPRETCEPQSAQEWQSGGLTIYLPEDSGVEASGGRDSADAGPAPTILSAMTAGEANMVAPLYRCLLQQLGYGLTSSVDGPLAPFSFTDGESVTGQVFIAPFPGLEHDFTRLVVIIQPPEE